MINGMNPLTPVSGFTMDQLFSDDVASLLTQLEGKKPLPYVDINGIPTVGIGLNLQAGAFANCVFGWRTAMKYMACLLLTILCAPAAKGACLDWSRSIGRPDHRLTYAGTLGDHPIRMMLRFNAATGHFDGAYGYNDQPSMLALSGNMQPGGVGADLDERDAQGQVTGHFSLKFFLPRPDGQDPVIYEKYPATCDALTGSWQSP